MQNTEELNTWLKQYQIADNLAGTEQKCMICGEKFTVRKSGFPPRYGICKKCKCSFTSKNRQVTKEQKQQQKEKALETWNSKSEEEKKSIIEKRKNSLKKTISNRTVEEKTTIRTHISKTQQNFSEEKKSEISEKKRIAQINYWNNLSQNQRLKLKQKNIDSHQTESFKEKRKLYEEVLSSEEKKSRAEKSSKNLKRTWLKKKSEIAQKISLAWFQKSEDEKKQIREKQKQTWKNKTFLEKQFSLQKFRQTWSQKSEEEKRQIRSKAIHKYIYDNEYFDSSWELALWIYAKDHNEGIERCPTTIQWFFENKKHEYYPDFLYKNELIEVKGEQFFKENGDLYNPFDRSLDKIMKAKQQCMLENSVKIFRLKDIQPILDYVEKTYTIEYLDLFKKDLPFPYPTISKNPSDFDVIRYFHKSLYKASRKGKLSPFEAWQDKNLIKKAALNRLKYVGRCTPRDILQGFNVAKIAPKVSVFKPSLAEQLIKNYLPDVDIIYDPFSGFSGRMLGAFNCDKQYFGFDINEDHVRESNEIIDYKKIGDMCSVEVKDLITTPSRDYTCLRGTCLFTCPPYGGKEHWNENNDEIEKSCDEWIDLCLEKYKVSKYLFVVDKTEKYKDKIVEVLENKSHLGVSKEYVVFIS